MQINPCRARSDTLCKQFPSGYFGGKVKVPGYLKMLFVSVVPSVASIPQATPCGMGRHLTSPAASTPSGPTGWRGCVPATGSPHAAIDVAPTYVPTETTIAPARRASIFDRPAQSVLNRTPSVYRAHSFFSDSLASRRLLRSTSRPIPDHMQSLWRHQVLHR